MLGVLLAERAILRNGESVGVVTLVFITVVIAVLALRTFKVILVLTSAFLAILEKLRTKKLHPRLSANLLYHTIQGLVNSFCRFLIIFLP